MEFLVRIVWVGIVMEEVGWGTLWGKVAGESSWKGGLSVRKFCGEGGG